MDTAAPSQAQIIDSLPAHLRPFVKLQDHASQYTLRDHAAWRFLMTALTRGLADTAHPVYLEGLAKTGMMKEPSLRETWRASAGAPWLLTALYRRRSSWSSRH